MMSLKAEIGDLKIALVETGVEVGPAIYLARVFDSDVDTVVKFFIFILIFVFDPMAVIFVISYNHVLMNDGLEPSKPTKKRKKKIDTKKMSDTLIKMINREPVSEDEVEEVVQVAEPKEVPQSRQGRKTQI